MYKRELRSSVTVLLYNLAQGLIFRSHPSSRRHKALRFTLHPTGFCPVFLQNPKPLNPTQSLGFRIKGIESMGSLGEGLGFGGVGFGISLQGSRRLRVNPKA